MRAIGKLCVILAIVVGTGCTAAIKPKKIDTQDWVKATQEVYAEYRDTSLKHLQPDFQRAGVHYPPQKITLIALKKERKMELWAQDKRGRKTYIKTYPILAHSGGPGPKLKEYDAQIPEGVYHISLLDPFSRLHLSMKINYPNQFDRWHAAVDGRKKLGGDIFIHGKRLSAGCIAIGDRAIEDLFVLVYDVGQQHTKVVIAPNDLRIAPPAKPNQHFPLWIHQLDRILTAELNRYNKKA